MHRISTPSIYCPIAPACNPHCEQVHTHSMRWAVQRGLVDSNTHAYKLLDDARLATLAAYTQPFHALDDIQLHGDWILWLFMLDDYVDNTLRDDSAHLLADLHTDLFAVLNGQDYTPSNSFAYALTDLCQRITDRSNQHWFQNFAKQLKDYLQSNMWESAIRAQGDTPDMATYTKMRLFTGAVYTCFTVVSLTSNIDPDADFLGHTSIRALTDMANLQICWSNDIIGIKHEYAEDSPNNLVYILQREYNLSFQAAMNRAIELVNKEMRAFLHLKTLLPSFGAKQDAQVRRYIAGLEQWMRGNIDWSEQTQRYQMAECV